MFVLCSIRDNGTGARVGGQRTDVGDQMGVPAQLDVGGHRFLRMRRRFNEMTTNDDFLTTFDDVWRGSLPGRNGFRGKVLFDISELRTLRSRNEGLLKTVLNQVVKGGFDDK